MQDLSCKKTIRDPSMLVLQKETQKKKDRLLSFFALGENRMPVLLSVAYYMVEWSGWLTGFLLT